MSNKLGPLDGILVVDFTRVLGPPYATQLLGDLGAEVLKIEMPEIGDDLRHFAPVINGDSYTFLIHNRNKKSITLNLKKEEGRQVLYKLLEKADVFVENVKPETAEELHIDYRRLSKLNPRLICCSISGFGQEGPLKNYPALDLIAQAMSGMISVSGEDGRVIPTEIAVADFAAGIYGTLGVIAALYSRDRTGLGQHVDVSLLRSSLTILGQLAGVYLGTGRSPRPGDKKKIIIPYGIFETKDKPIVVESAGVVNWKKLVDAIGIEWLRDEKFATPAARAKNREELIPGLQAELKKKASAEWLEIFAKMGVPSAPILDLKEVFEHPHMIETGMVATMEHPKHGKLRMVGPAIKFSGTPITFRLPAPDLGQHTEEVLSRFGYNKEEVGKLRSQGII